LTKSRGKGSSLNWKPSLRKNISIIDFFSLLFAVTLILTLRFPQTWQGELSAFEIRNIFLALLVLFSWLFFLWFNGSRDTNILGFGADEYKRLINATLFSFTSIAFISYIFKLEISRAFILLVFPFGLITLFISRRMLRRRLLKARSEGRYLSKVLLLHSGENDPVESRLSIASHAGFNVVYKVQTLEGSKLDFKQIIGKAIENNCDQIMVGQSAIISAAELRKLGWALEETSIDLIVAPAVTEQPVFSGVSRVTKRLLDLVLSVIGLIVISPFLLIVALMIKFYDRGSIFYTQKRIGQNNKEFSVYKFRTMYEGSHEQRGKVMAETNKDPRLAKDPQDPRVTKPGLFLRRWSIDEIPQIINVLKGEMSLVGPRPPLAEEVNQYEKSEKRRLLVKPGLTGLWQVSGRSELDWEDAVRLDLYYVENWSLTLDILIIIRTAAAVWRGEGAY
jgi:lipopolysaccharide/colanic/teichoic acid biosynthesis glycosyltransferase